MTVVSNTSPIINLAAIQQVTLLHQLYGRLIIPSAVYHEIVVQGAGQPGAQEVQTEAWFEHQPLADPGQVLNLLQRHPQLNRAEAEAILLAVELKADRLLMDETQGRRTARAFGVPIRGCLGVLVEAKRRGLIPAVKPLMDDLISHAHFFIAQPVYAETLHHAGE